MEILVPWPGIKFIPPAEHGVSTTGPPGKSREILLSCHPEIPRVP